MVATASGNPSMDASDDKSHRTHHQSLEIPEILIGIFANCSPSTSAALTRVCRTWSDLASDQLWSSLPSLLPLLRILLPLVIVDGSLDFDRSAGPPNWERFWAAAARVRRLKHNDGQAGDTTQSLTQLNGRISPNVIPLLLLRQSWTSRKFLLPRLETLEWRAKWEHSLLQLCHFVSPSLRNLAIVINKSVPADLATRNLECLAYLPSMNIEVLRIGTNYATPDSDLQLAPVVASFLKSQPTLSIIVARDLWSRGEVVDGLIQHTDLHSLELLLHSNTELEVRSVLDLLARQCPRLCSFILTLSSELPLLSPRNVTEPLLSCSLLQQLQIFHTGGLRVTSADVRDMAHAWRNMEVLHLCANATKTIHLDTPLALLLDFAEEFSPHLRRLALNFSCHGELPTADVVWTSFPKLQVLGVGTSTVSSTDQAIVIGEFLASICSTRTKIAYIPDASWRCDVFDAVTWRSSPNASHWGEVAAVLESGQRLQMAALAKALRANEYKES